MERSLCDGSRVGRGDSDSIASIAGSMNESPVRLAGSAAGDCGDPLPGRDGPGGGGGGGGSVPSRGAPGCCGLALAADELAAKRDAGESV